ncbi:homeobox-leucine zipper protein ANTHOCYANINLESS [Trifolium repens]|nr:homeobox-leucine zipper protein ANTHOCYANINLESS [Trifolium repens]
MNNHCWKLYRSSVAMVIHLYTMRLRMFLGYSMVADDDDEPTSLLKTLVMVVLIQGLIFLKKDIGMTLLGQYLYCYGSIIEDRWAEMFPCMIVEAETLDVFSNGIDGINGSIQLMHAEIQLPSPLVPVREYNFISCKKLPSGCILQDMPNGFCKITWVDHSQYDESAVCSGLGLELAQSRCARRNEAHSPLLIILLVILSPQLSST